MEDRHNPPLADCCHVEMKCSFAKFFQFFNRSQRSKGAGIPSQSLNIGKQFKIYKNAIQAIQTRLGAKWGPRGP